MSTKLDQLKAKLRELFQLDRPDLDFGFYRIMHAKQAELDRFLDCDLLPQVQAALASLEPEGSAELDEAIKNAKSLGVDPDTVPKVRELRKKYDAPSDLTKTEDDLYSHLYRFFSRYYDTGDFISMRRYKEGVYAIPYEGEEVVLHWANKDQYYIKSSVNLRDYTVKLDAGDDAPRLRFKLVEADVEKDNVKAADDKKRVFIFNPFKTEVSEYAVVLAFEYRPDTEGRKQEALIADCVEYVKNHAADFGAFVPLLLATSPTEKRKDRTLLEKHLVDYTSKNTMDYFIHKDLGGFLRRELDFYIKNEVVHLDDIEQASAPRVESFLSQIRIIRAVAHKIIDFLAQLEDFQKKLWLKKKFVVQTDWCITLDRVPDGLFPQIAKNDAQMGEWIKLGFIEEVQIPDLKKWLFQCAAKGKDHESKDAPKDLFGKTDSAYSPQPSAFSLFMLVDTAFFDAAFKQKLLASIEDLDAQTNGLLIHSENFQALNLLQEQYREQVKCVYIDPPYNTGNDDFPYKDGYQSSSWVSMMQDRLNSAYRLMTSDGNVGHYIDEKELTYASALLSYIFGEENRVVDIIWKNSSKNDQSYVSMQHEYFIGAVKSKKDNLGDWTERKEGLEEIYVAFEGFRKKHGSNWKAIHEEALKWYRQFSDSNPIRDSKHYSWMDDRGVYFPDNISGPNFGQYRYDVIHPTTKKVCKEPASGWRYPRNTILERIHDGFVHFGDDETTVPNNKTYLKDTERQSLTSIKYRDGRVASKLLAAMFGGKTFTNPKDVDLSIRLLRAFQTTETNILDFFAGTGTTAHAVINLNREDNGNRKYILVEMGDHFNTVLKPRIQKVVFSKDWKDGRPSDPASGVSNCFKYLRLESYEDCLNNLELKRTPDQEYLLKHNEALKEDYTLRYMLDVESRDSLLNVSAFADPFSYTLKIATGSVGETRPVNVDLVETFNCLIGLKVKTLDVVRSVTVVTGKSLAGEKILVLWRKTAETDSDALNAWFVKQGYNTQDMAFDVIYVNGNNNLENLRRDEQTWKVRLVEEEFLRRMFGTEGNTP